jgi:uncharacterized membrane protein YcaP (DUF421 family)
MDSVISAAVVYVFLRLFIGLMGRRSLGQLTPFQLVLLIVIGGAVQRALVGDDPSLTNAIIIVATLVGLELLVSLIRQRSHVIGRVLRGGPLIVVENGRPLARRMHRARISEDDVLAAARLHHGLTSIDEVKYAILEANGEISIVPERKAAAPRPIKFEKTAE